MAQNFNSSTEDCLHIAESQPYIATVMPLRHKEKNSSIGPHNARKLGLEKDRGIQLIPVWFQRGKLGPERSRALLEHTGTGQWNSLYLLRPSTFS